MLLLLAFTSAPECAMGHTFIDNARKRYSYQLLKHRPALQYSMISHRVQEQFGKRQPLIAPSTLTAIKQAGDLTGDPCYTSPVLRAGRTLTYGHKKLILDELMELCTVSTAELERKLRQVELTQRTSFASSTIDDAIRAASWTSKKVTLLNARRCPYASAQTRVALGAYPVECILVLDASHIASDEAQRRRGRAPRGSAAHSNVFTCAGGELMSVLGAITIDGFDMDICEVVEGSIDGDRYYEFIEDRVYPRTNPYDHRHLVNSVIALDNVNIQHQPRIIRLFRRKGVKVIFLARYDPRCSPIEMAFSKMKYYLRYVLSRALFASSPKIALRAALRGITACDACGYFRAARLMRDFDAAVCLARRERLVAQLVALLVVLL